MSKKQFSGTSNNGNVSEAVSIAVKMAKEELQTDYIDWELNDVSGSYGGFTLQTNLTATITVRATKPSVGTNEPHQINNPQQYDGMRFIPNLPYQSTNGSQSLIDSINSKQTLESKQDPIEICKNLLQSLLIDGEKLPPIKSIELYHIRCLAYGMGEGKEVTGVYFPPEFLYLADVGYPYLAGISIISPRIGQGAPDFPNFKNAAYRSVKSRASNDLIFPDVTGEIMVGTHEDLELDTIKELLAPYAYNIHGNDSFFTAKCKPFHEKDTCREIETNIKQVKYASTNSIVRIIDIVPGWEVDRVL
ncbi:MAG: hypothetical protein JAZ06_02420 [Candidatus Thiodiazotropha taylori]|nr:hypothetical protein [Candidatus Thiodiazotropha taylori]